MNETSFDFGGKYREAGRVGGFLIDRFYAGIGRLLRGRPVQSALEVGCGEGYSTHRLRRLLDPSCRLEALDVEQRLVDAARAKNPGVAIELGSAYDLAHPDNAFDLLFCMEVLEHLDEPERALAELRRVAKTWLLLTVPREPIWRTLNMARGKYLTGLGNTPGHIQHWSRRSFVRTAGRYGTPVQVETPLPWTQVLLRVEP